MSKHTLSSALREYVAACFTGLWVQSQEHEDALAEIARLCRAENWRLSALSARQVYRSGGVVPRGRPLGP